MPKAEQQDERSHRDEGGGDVDEGGAVEGGDEKLYGAEADAADEAGGPDFLHAAPASLRGDEPEGDDDREDG